MHARCWVPIRCILIYVMICCYVYIVFDMPWIMFWIDVVCHGLILLIHLHDYIRLASYVFCPCERMLINSKLIKLKGKYT